MAKVWIKQWECASGNLPACCVVCGGEEEIEYLEHEMEYRPSWPITFLGFHFLGWHLVGGFLGWFSERYNRLVFTRLPYCGDHYDYWEKREHRQHLGALIIALGWFIPMIVTFINNINMRMSPKWIAIGVSATVVGLIVIYSYGFKMVHVADMKRTRLLMADVHPDFAAAVKPQQEHEE